MTPLEYIATNPSYEDAKNKWLLFTEAQRNTMLAKQETLTTNHKVSTVALTDGRYGACADLMTEINEGQAYYELFALLDLSEFDTAELVDTPKFEALLPEPEDI